MIRFEDIPHQYGLCLNDDCPLAHKCLRHLALEALPESKNFATILLPGRCTPRADGTYTYYHSNTKVRYACGFRSVLTQFPVQVLNNFRDYLIMVYPRNKYFKIRRGDIHLSPKEQEFIIRVAKEQGFQGEFTFDKYEEDYLWQ